MRRRIRLLEREREKAAVRAEAAKQVTVAFNYHDEVRLKAKTGRWPVGTLGYVLSEGDNRWVVDLNIDEQVFRVKAADCELVRRWYKRGSLYMHLETPDGIMPVLSRFGFVFVHYGDGGGRDNVSDMIWGDIQRSKKDNLVLVRPNWRTKYEAASDKLVHTIQTHKIVKISDKQRKTLYQHPTYHHPPLKLVPMGGCLTEQGGATVQVLGGRPKVFFRGDIAVQWLRDGGFECKLVGKNELKNKSLFFFVRDQEGKIA